MTLKVSEHVVLLSGGKFARAIRYAIEQGASVVTMSMAGAPSRSMLSAVNEAYEAGVVVVAAAGNSWVSGGRKLLPKHTMYPARFNRVVGVTGATLDKTPYLINANENWQTREVGGSSMQTCYGPDDVCSSNIAAYTPNVQWAGKFGDSLFNASGGGTSSATPQVAAAAAMYMYVHRKELANLEPAMRAEITRQALFRSAEQSQIPEHNHVFGTGMLKARDALALKPSQLKRGLKLAEKDRLGWFISDDIFKQLFNIQSRGLSRDNARAARNKRDMLIAMLRTELAQLCYLDPNFKDIDKSASINELCLQVEQSSIASQFLKRQLKTIGSIGVPLDQQRAIMVGGPKLLSSHVVHAQKDQRFLVSSSGCGFIAQSRENNEPDVHSEFEITPVATRSSASGPSAITLEMISSADSGPALIVEQDMNTGEETFRWMLPQTSEAKPGARSVLASEQKTTLQLPSGMGVGSRGLGSGIKRFIVKVYRTVKDKPLSDLTGLIVGKIENDRVVWQKRNAEIDRVLRTQTRILFFMHGTYSSAEIAFEALTENAKFLQKLKSNGFGEYVLAYNMSTIRSSVSQNARSLKSALTKLKVKNLNEKISVVAHSRGCLVARKAFPASTKMVLVAGTHHGTPLADGAHLGSLINRVSNLAALTMTKTGSLPLFLMGISRLIQFGGNAEGLVDQKPDSALTRALLKDAPMTRSQLLIAANFEPTSAVLRRLDDVAVDILLFNRMSNDGVTPVDSALAKLDLGEAVVKLMPNNRLHHLNLFSDAKVQEAIVKHFMAQAIQ